ncbi:hypothetical protein HQ563_15215 [bacterium]|nr:hypothetical protein [bacterium]
MIPAISGDRVEQSSANHGHHYNRNADRKVTREEFLGLWTEAFRNQDKDGDGMLNVTEFGDPVSFKHADPSQDGKATFTEFTKMYYNQFDGLDKNKDGLLTVEEM